MSENDRRDALAGFHTADLDPQLIADVARQGLEVRRVDDASRDETDPWLNAVARGFLDGERSDVQREAFFERTAYRRKLGVFDGEAPSASVPVATFASWQAELTVPGGAMPACAISSVTVAPTHRRRGLLRSLMAGELRTALGHGFPIAVLTVSESSIYGRFGFAPAAAAAHWEIKVRRARWIGPVAPGRIDFLSREDGRALAPDLHARTRLRSPGEIEMPGGHWDRIFGTRPDADKPENLRVLQYRGQDGAVDGLVVYSVTENHDDYSESTVDVALLLAATDEAYAGLWRFLLSMDLIGTIRASELAVDEPLWWMIADQRAATITVRDHQYLRVLDVPAALAARRYDAAEELVLQVDDPLEIASGVYVVRVDDEGAAVVDVVDDAPPGLALSRLGVAELSAILLGGVSPVTLARAGRIVSDDPARLARLFATPTAPRLSFWY
ncbi:GNAT family N-acetyltransferase [Microbacterium telephonicum]|uniref:Putative acetyltransferase n=1 Tax=Microbacterium telephonicum TaxID=1714841 RepID=A0A498C9F2_9MICO|nr:GNAT family N-acetyltransferase [Microbacterium telephonicum]RLK48961.1 putative acetyltransferase [Microbacterium telephonicum]